MPSKISPTQRTLKALRDEGFLVEVVERWIPGANIRKDLFSFIDIVAIKGGRTLAVQACSGGDINKRVDKITNHENLPAVREAGWEIQVWGWRKLKSGWAPIIVDLS